MKYCMIGAGAMGLRYGIHLSEHAGCEVDYIDCWDEHINKIAEQGGVWAMRDHEERHLVPINLYRPEDYTGNPGCWIVFMKQMQLEDMLKRCAHLFKPGQICFTAMNGMGHYGKLLQYFEPAKLFGGTAVIATVLPGAGEVDFMGPLGKELMHLCAYDNSRTPAGDALYEDLKAAKLGPEWSPDIMSMSIIKLMLNAVVNTLCTMFEMPMGILANDAQFEPLCQELVHEGFEVCKRAGIDLGLSEEEEVDAIVTSTKDMPLHFPSMCQDMFKSRPTEVDYINGYLVKLGREHGYECVRHEFLTRVVHLAEAAHRYHNPED